MPSNLERQTTSPARRFSDLFDVDFPDLFRWFEDRRPGLLGSPERIRVEEEVAEGVLHIRAEVPGIDPEKDADISISEGVLQVKVERRQESKAEDEGRVRSEFHYGSFYRAIPLPKGADASQVTASYKDGILDISVPVPEPAPAQAQKVAINRG